MSSITNVIQTEFRARGSQLLATMSQMSSSTGMWTQRLGETSRMSDRINQQWRAIGTTIRYAIAGQAVFGLTRMIGQLNQVQQQLGLIQAIGQQGRTGQPFTTQQVTSLGNALQSSAADSITSITDMNNAAINFLSTVQDINRQKLPDILKDIARGATLTQTPIEDLTQLVTTMNIAFGRKNTPQAISQNVAQWFELIRLAPGGIKAAPQLVQAIPNVSTVFQQGLQPNLTDAGRRRAQADMFSLVLGTLRFGATPATAMRGLAYFLQSLETPATPRAAKALAGIGISPASVRRRGIYATTLTFLRHIAGNLTPQQLAQIQSIPEDQLQEGQNLPGVAPNQMVFLRESLGRIHAIRAAIVLASQLGRRGGVASLEDDLNTILREQNRAGTNASDMARAWQDYSKRAQLQDMANRVNIMLLQLAQSFEGILNFFARSVVDPITKFAQGHRGVTRDVTLGAAGIGIAGGLFSFLRRGGALTRGVAGVQTVRSLAGLEADGTAAKPFFVIVQNQIYRPYGGPSPTGGGLPPEEGGPGGRRGRFGRPGRFSRAGRALGTGLIYGTILDTIAQATTGQSIYDPQTWHVNNQTGKPLRWSDALPWNWGIGKHPIWSITHPFSPMTQRNQKAMSDLATAQAIFNSRGNRGTIIGASSDPNITWQHGNAEITLNVNVRQPDGRISKARIHIPYSTWQHNKFPSRAGKVKGRT